jgi:FdrA protein
VALAGGVEPPPATLRALPTQEAGRLVAEQRFLRGLYSGGTLCYEALVLLRRYLGSIWSNTPLRPEEALDPVTRSREHTILDLGGDEFTWGRLHPMIDPALRVQRMEQEASDPSVAILLLDVVLGYGAHPDPAAVYAPVIRRLRAQAGTAGRHLCVIASVCGTDADPQNAAAQREALVEAGALVEDSNARAVRVAGLVAEAHGSRGAALEPPVVRAAPQPPAWPGVDPVLAMLRKPPAAINVGLEVFAESLAAQGVPVVPLDWRPPAGGKPHLLDLLDKLEA